MAKTSVEVWKDLEACCPLWIAVGFGAGSASEFAATEPLHAEATF